VCLAGVSKWLRVLSEGSPRWKAWCEKACPALKISPATELVSAHFEQTNRGPGFYPGLFLELKTERRRLAQLPSVLDQTAGQCEESALKSPTLGEFLMVMDIFLGGDCNLSCSAGAEAMSCAEGEMVVTDTDLTPDLEEFEWGTFFSSRTPFERSQAASEASLDTFVAHNYHCTESTLPQLSPNLRLLRKSDMGLLTLLKGAAIIVHRRSHCKVENLIMWAFGEARPIFKSPNGIVAMKLSKVGAPWRTYRLISRWLWSFARAERDGS
jgi:hypothetical protein